MTESVAGRVLQETLRFREALPALLVEHAGKWVVFKGGQVQSVHETEDEAYRAGLEKFGRDGGQVIALVIEQRPAPVTAGALFNLG